MEILVIGSAQKVEDVKARFGNHHVYRHAVEHRSAFSNFTGREIIFDFVLAGDPSAITAYPSGDLTAFIDSVAVSLHELFRGMKDERHFVRFNGLPGFFANPLLELSLLHRGLERELATVCRQLGTEYVLVDDRAGMVTPRIVFMIINEAYYTVQDGTATREDIDRAMKTGTNYPYGPFEWAGRLGVATVYKVLKALYDDTGDSRYKICPLLKKEYLEEALPSN